MGNLTEKQGEHLRADFLSERATARWLSLTPQTLKRWRSRRQGPPYYKIGKRAVRYHAADVLAWIESQSRGATTDG